MNKMTEEDINRHEPDCRDRLLRERDRVPAAYQICTCNPERLRAELAAAKAENERLAAWLTHIRNTGDEFGFIAEEALDGTPFAPEPAP